MKKHNETKEERKVRRMMHTLDCMKESLQLLYKNSNEETEWSEELDSVVEIVNDAEYSIDNMYFDMTHEMEG